MKELSNVKSFEGAQVRYEHFSNTLGCRMTFSVFYPKFLITDNSDFPVVYWLSGLTCTDENFVQKQASKICLRARNHYRCTDTALGVRTFRMTKMAPMILV